MSIKANFVKNALWQRALALLLLSATTHAFAGPGNVDTTFNVLCNNTVDSALTLPSGKILIGGAFNTVNGLQRGPLARLFPDGTLDTTFSNSISSGGTVFAMLLQPDGKLLVAGSFSAFVVSQNRQNLVRLNVDGSIDGTFTNNGPTTPVLALGLQTDGKVLIGGQFTSIGNSNHFYIARLNTDGTVDNSFIPGTISGSMVNAIAVQDDGNILIGGSFSSFSSYGLTRNNIARLLTNGVPDPVYQATASGPVQAVYLEPSGKSVWAGAFTSLDSFSRSHIGRLNTDGTLDSGFTANIGVNNTVFAVTEDTNDDVYVGGSFNEYNNSIRESVARLFSDGTLDNTFNNTTNFNTPQVKCLAIQGDGRVLVGGTFTTFNSSPRTNLVRLYGDNYPAEIVTQPQGRNVGVGTNVTFSVEVSNPTMVDYQWRLNGVDIPGAIFNEYSVFNTQLGDAGSYSVFCDTGFGGTTSSNAVLQVGIPPVITQSPSNLTVIQGQTALFTATASGTPLNYYWKFNQKVVGTNATLTLTNVLPGQAGSYVLVASNFLGSTNSAPAILTVLFPITSVSSPASQSVAVGSTASFAVTAIGNPLSYQWLKNGNLITNAISSQFSIANVALTDTAGYSVIVSNQFNSITSTVAQLTVGNPPVVTVQPVTVTNNLGDTVSFNGAVTGDAPITYQWLFNGNPITNQGGTNLSFTNLTLTNVQIANIGNYSLSAANPFGSTVSSNAFLNLNGYPSNVYFGLVAWYPFSGNANDATGNGNNGLVNGAVLVPDRFGNTNRAYDFQGAQDITFTNVPLTQTDNWTISVWISPDVLPQAGVAVGLGMDSTNGADGMEIGISDGNFLPGTALFGGISGTPFVSGYSFTNTNAWHQAIMVRNSGTTQIYVDGVPMPGTSSSTPITPSSFAIGSGTAFRYFLGELDEVRIYNRALSTNDIDALYALENGQPMIIQQPQPQTVVAGGTANFSVQASGSGTLCYQWYHSNAPITCATNPVLTLTGVQASNAGPYYVIVTNNSGATPSTAASLTVGNPPQTLLFHLNPDKSIQLQMPGGTSGFNYVLQTATNLQPPVIWQNVTSLPADTNGLWTFTDTNPPASGLRFYRVTTP
jgi:uncharacterized delta-60 repeat protein